MAGFKLSEALIGRMADGMGVRPGTAMLQGIQQGQEQVQQRTDNRNDAELLEMKKQEFKQRSEQYNLESKQLAREEFARNNQQDAYAKLIGPSSEFTNPEDIDRIERRYLEGGTTAAFEEADAIRNKPRLATDAEKIKNQFAIGDRVLINDHTGEATLDKAAGVRDNKIADQTAILIARGIDPEEAREQAILMVDDVINMTTSETADAVVMTDLTNYTARSIAMNNGASMAEAYADNPIPIQESLYYQADDATGFGNAVQRWLSNAPLVRDELSGGEMKAIQAAQNLKLFGRDLVSAFAENPRLPIAEQEIVTDAVNIEPSLWGNAPSLRAGYRGLDTILRRIKDDHMERGSNPDLSPKDRALYRNDVKDIEAALKRLGVPDTESLSKKSKLTVEDVSGLAIYDIKQLPINDDAWLNKQSDEVLDVLLGNY